MSKHLSELLHSIPLDVLSRCGEGDPFIHQIVQDSRQVAQGDLFVANMGGSVDGHAYIPKAIENGAVAIIGSRPADGFEQLSVPYLQVAEPRYAMAHLAAAVYDFPARKMVVIGVTGTDGKTTTSNIIYQILKRAGYKAGIISTVNAVIGDEVIDTGFHVTTPEAQDVQRYLAQMAAAGITHVVLETTSHGLVQHRVTGCEYDIAVVTNITHEHLDYHGNYANYLAAKGLLFSRLSESALKAGGVAKFAVLNEDDQSYDYLNSITDTAKISYGLRSGDLFARDIRYDAQGLHFIAKSDAFEVTVTSKLIGDFNVSNILAAIGATVMGLDIPAQTACEGIAELTAVPGRMEQIDMGQRFTAIVDFAHTPNALKRALETVRGMTKGRVIAVFGSAGLRDREKRRMMAEVSAGLADITILTAEDPRTESLDGILEEMAKAAVGRGGVEGVNFFRIADRGDAIRKAVQLAQAGDLVVSCGKGHEQSMCFGTVEYAWDDRIAMRAALAECLQIDGPKMPHLPTGSE